MSTTTRSTTRRGFGTVRRLPSGRYQASYIWPAGGTRYTAPTTFQTKTDAAAWLAGRQTDLARGVEPGAAPAARPGRAEVFAAYAARWLAERDLRGRSVIEYRSIIAGHLVPAFGSLRLDEITVAGVRSWYASYGGRTPSARSKAYRVLHAIMASALDEEAIAANPVRVPRGGSDPTVRRIEPATPEEVFAVADAIRPEWRMMILLAAYCALRFGEVAALRRADVDLDRGALSIGRAVTLASDGTAIVGPPKSRAGIREVAIPEGLLGDLRRHILAHAEPGEAGLLFTAPEGGLCRQSSMWRFFRRAADSVGLKGFRFHDLRHTGATWAAGSATMPEVMRFGGWADYRVALRYQHAADTSGARIAASMPMPARGGAA